MPLLQYIAHELDQELDRLHSLRRIVAGLGQTPALVGRYAKTAPVGQPPTPKIREEKPSRRARRDAGTKRGPRVRKAADKTGALTGTVPNGPVVFYPGRSKPVPEPAQEEPEQIPVEHSPEELEAQSRALAARWAASGPTP